MTILSSGSTYALTIPAGNALVTIDLSGTSTVTGVTREDASRWHGTGAKACNPVATATAVTISTTGQVDYRFVAGDATPSSEVVRYNPVTYDSSAADAAAVAAAYKASTAPIVRPTIPTGFDPDTYMIAAPAWAATTVYPINSIVRLPSWGNALMRQTVSQTGTSGATEPVINQANKVTDGTCGWEFIGWSRASNAAGAPNVTAYSGDPTLSGGVAKNFYTDLFLTGLVTVYGNPVQLTGGYSGATQINTHVNNVTPAQGGACWAVEFMTDASIFAIQGRNTQANVRKDQFRVLVDGIVVEEDPTQIIAGTNPSVKFDFSGVSQQAVRPRLVRIEGNVTFSMYQIWIRGDKIWPAPRRQNLAVVFGDSVTCGGNTITPPFLPWQRPAYKLGRRLGMDFTVDCGFSSIGYVALNSAVFANIEQQLSLTAGTAPNASAVTTAPGMWGIYKNVRRVVFAAGWNDDSLGGNTTAITAAAALRSWRMARQYFPSARITVLGTWCGKAGTSNPTDAALYAAFVSWADTNSEFIDMKGGVDGPWFSGGGNFTAPNAAGNADLYCAPDSPHHNVLGTEAWTQRVAAGALGSVA